MAAASILAAASVALAVTATSAPAPQPPTQPAASTSSPSDWQLDANASIEARGTTIFEDPLEVGRPLPTDQRKLEGLRIIEQRARIGAELEWGRSTGLINQVNLRVQADLLNGPSARGSAVDGTDGSATSPDHAPTASVLAVDPEYQRDLSLGAGDKFYMRQFAVEARSRWGRILAGRTVSQWGLGLLAQDGVDDPMQFGFKRRAAVVDRVQMTLIPGAIPGDGTWAGVFPVALVLAYDNVYEDDLAAVAQGEDATNLIGAALAKFDDLEIGVYAVRREQTDSRGLYINANVADFYARFKRRFGRYKVNLATEWLQVSGDTTYFRTATNPDALKVDQLGGVVRADLARGKFRLRLEGGLASADQNAWDDTVRNFKLARDYRVGLVLFHDVMRRVSSNTAANLADPRFAGQPPAGYERIATAGSVSQAMYLHPVLRIGDFYGISGMIGYLWARSPSKYVDPHKSSLKGGAAIGPMGGPASDDLGTELDLAIQYRVRIDKVALIARADWGCATLGEAFADEDGKVADGVCTVMGQLLARARW